MHSYDRDGEQNGHAASEPQGRGELGRANERRTGWRLCRSNFCELKLAHRALHDQEVDQSLAPDGRVPGAGYQNARYEIDT